MVIFPGTDRHDRSCDAMECKIRRHTGGLPAASSETQSFPVPLQPPALVSINYHRLMDDPTHYLAIIPFTGRCVRAMKHQLAIRCCFLWCPWVRHFFLHFLHLPDSHRDCQQAFHCRGCFSTSKRTPFRPKAESKVLPQRFLNPSYYFALQSTPKTKRYFPFCEQTYCWELYKNDPHVDLALLKYEYNTHKGTTVLLTSILRQLGVLAGAHLLLNHSWTASVSRKTCT